MLKIVVLLSITTCALGAVLTDEQLSQLGGRIVGGADATIHAYPWQVSLQSNGMHYCGGFIYSKNIIITAAHCTDDLEPNMIFVRAGSANRESGGVLIQVAAFKIHEDFVGRQNDIGILRLVEDLTFSSTIRPISLASKEPPTGTPSVVTGWGQTYDGEPTRPVILKYVDVKIIDWKLCRSDSYKYGDYVVPNMICAAAPGRDACLDDSGGAMVSQGLAVGIVSYGIGCAEKDYPGIYSNIAVLKEWVETNVKLV